MGARFLHPGAASRKITRIHQIFAKTSFDSSRTLLSLLPLQIDVIEHGGQDSQPNREHCREPKCGGGWILNADSHNGGRDHAWQNTQGTPEKIVPKAGVGGAQIHGDKISRQAADGAQEKQRKKEWVCCCFMTA